MARAEIYYDADCGLCSAVMRHTKASLGRRGFDFVPMQEPRVSRLLGLMPGELAKEMKLRTSDGRILGGVETFRHIADQFWWGKPIAWALSVRVVNRVALVAYRWVARNRGRISKMCRLRPGPPVTTR